jgi:hypothetical protein
MLRFLPLPDWLLSTARQHPALLISIAYLLLSSIGMMFSWAFFRRFDINYFLFAEIGDFLLAVLREPMSVIAAMGGIAVTVLLYAYTDWEYRALQRKTDPGRIRRLYARLQRLLMRLAASPLSWALFLLIYMYLLISIIAVYRVVEVRQGKGTVVWVQIGSGEPLSAVLMGSSGRFMFLYDPHTEATRIVANEVFAGLIVAPEE